MLLEKINSVRACSSGLKIDNDLHQFFPSRIGRLAVDLICLPLGLANYIQLSINAKATQSSNAIKTLAICSIVKNEAAYLDEFVRFHIAQGVDKFYFYDNDSDDNIMSVLEPYIKRGYVELNKIKGMSRQLDAYNDALRKHRADVDAIALIDADEFMMPAPEFTTAKNAITSFFEHHPNACGLAVNWKLFGSNGYKTLEERPNLVTKAFTYRAADSFEKNWYIKSIVRPTRVLAFLNSHLPNCMSNRYCLNTKGEEVKSPLSRPCYDYLAIHHYFCKSYEEFLAKRNRGKADSLDMRPIAEFAEHDQNVLLDDSATSVLN